MKTSICIAVFLIAMFCSCKKQAPVKLPDSYLEYLDEKGISGIIASGNDMWVSSYTTCTTCDVPPYMSFIPLTYQLTKISGNSYEVDENAPVLKPVRDRNGNLFATGSDRKNIYKINDLKNYSLIVETGDFFINDFVFDNNNHIWMWGSKGIGYWNGSELKTFNTSNSILPTDITHGIAVDSKGIIWVPLDFGGKGILKIDNGNWSIVPLASIAGITGLSYVSSPVADNEGNIWFRPFAVGQTGNKTIKYNGNSWTIESSTNSIVSILGKDQKGTIWKTESGNNNLMTPNSLFYLKNNEWQPFDTGGAIGYIFSVETNDDKVFIGTSRGLLMKPRI